MIMTVIMISEQSQA